MLDIRQDASEIWAYRHYIMASVLRDIRGRYRGSLLGFFWIIIPPVVMIAIYSIVFSALMKARLPHQDSAFAYSIYLCAGLLLWNGFVDIVQRCKGVFLDNANLIKKSVFPRSVLFVSILLFSTFNTVVSLLLFTPFALFSGHAGWAVLNLVPVLLLLSLLALGVGLLVSTLNVFFRDVGQISDLGLQFLFWLTPIAYPLAIVPEWAARWLRLNPLADLLAISQGAYLSNQGGTLLQWLFPACFSLSVFILGVLVYRFLSARILDEL